jgi:cellulose synthase/poly-beta-1,6-N-acetylglucosamine synthase-like glycosyltransferase/peptidoglycan/xylan/chitin deacetylase (PgdA/CDA1 family)
MADKPIFHDASGRRAAWVSLIGWAAAIASTLVGAFFFMTLMAVTPVQNMRLPGQLTAVQTREVLERKAKAPGLVHAAEALAWRAKLRRSHLAALRRTRTERRMRAHPFSSAMRPRDGRPLSIAFYPDWSVAAYPALKHALPRLDAVMPTWTNLTGPDAALHTHFDPRVYAYIRSHKPDTAILPVLQNAAGGKWDGAGLAKLLADPLRRAALVDGLVQFVGQHHLQGATIDFEEMPATARADLALFLKSLHARFAPHRWTLAQTAPFDDGNWPFMRYARLVDYTVLMAYDQHMSADPAGPIAGETWYEHELDKRMRVLAPSRTIIALGNYGYDWNGSDVDSLTFQDAVIAAHDSGARVHFDDASDNPHFSYREEDGTLHNVWFLDAATAFNEVHAADIYQPAGYAMWRLGSEDPSVWDVLDRRYGAGVPKGLTEIPINDDIDYEGRGEILRVAAEPAPGKRRFDLDRQSGDIDDETYTQLPTSYVVRQFGAKFDKRVALTFDDGPDPQWTPKILSILEAEHVPATFFIIGSNAEANPGLVQRMVADGDEVGNHTYTHPNLADTSREGVRLELNATQRLFEALTGRSLRLFRPPYLGDAEPTDVDELIPVEIAQSMGYVTVGEHVDPLDWARPGEQAIISRTLDQIRKVGREMPRNIVLLHDAGGDRSETVAALPILIDRLRAEGYHFVPVSNLTGLSRAEAMPPLPPTVALMTDRVVFMTLSTLGHILYLCFLAAIILGIGRMVFLVLASLWRRRHQGQEFEAPPAEQPTYVSVVIPAYNEESVIARTLHGILGGTYRNLEVVVIDDGSKDATGDVVEREFGADARVRLIRAANGGKARALNIGLSHAKGDVIVALDADTQFNRDTIARLVRWFSDDNVGAVAGNAKVGNRINMITRWQALEYIVAQNLERRALAALGTLTVVPGAVGAWRKSVLEALGGFRTDTLAEDQDLTIAVQQAGWRVQFDSTAIAWTEAPATVRGLAKQRFRWAYGTLQCLWKYRRMTFNPRYGTLGMIALPQVWLFQILLTALAPLADLLLLWQLGWQYLAYMQHGAEFSNSDLNIVVFYYLIFVVVDLLAAVIGFLMETREQWSLLWWLMLQRFGYRQIMYYVVLRSISTALKGAVVGWGKLERAGTVTVREAPENAG